jgi:hypothetical protein
LKPETAGAILARRARSVLPRQDGDELVIVVKTHTRGAPTVSLTQRNWTTTTVIPLSSVKSLFSRDEVQQAILARGWRLDASSQRLGR